MRMLRQNPSKIRRGLCRVDVIVCLLVGVLIVTVAVPGCVGRRDAARRGLCMKNMYALGMAISSFSAQNAGRIPNLTSELEISRGPDAKSRIDIPWTVTLFPMLDKAELLNQIKQNAVTKEDGSAVIAESDKVSLPVFTCPSATDSSQQAAGLNYVVNTGFIPQELFQGDPKQQHRLGTLRWNESDAPESEYNVHVSGATGVVWRNYPPYQPWVEWARTGDGESHTLLLAENLQAGPWYDTDTARIGFGLPIAAPEGKVARGPGTVFASVDRLLHLGDGTLTTAQPQNWRVNCDLKAATGTRSRPSSNHSDVVNVILCDGRGKAIAQSIDPQLYVRLLTQNGIAYGEATLKDADVDKGFEILPAN